jgi:1,4-alpha-glucan branching enzyme
LVFFFNFSDVPQDYLYEEKGKLTCLLNTNDHIYSGQGDRIDHIETGDNITIPAYTGMVYQLQD